VYLIAAGQPVQPAGGGARQAGLAALIVAWFPFVLAAQDFTTDGRRP
jgi:hypothetical protein